MFGRIALVLMVLVALVFMWPIIKRASNDTAKRQAELDKMLNDTDPAKAPEPSPEEKR